jgi:uncharacterized protein (TIGR03382 family)
MNTFQQLFNLFYTIGQAAWLALLDAIVIATITMVVIVFGGAWLLRRRERNHVA